MWVLAGAEVDGPVNKVQIQIVQLKLGKSVVKRGLDVSGVVLRIPELRCDENVLTLKARDILEGTFNALSDLLLVLIAVIGGKSG